MDVVGGVILADGWNEKIVSGVDDHRGLCVGAGGDPGDGAAVCDELAQAMRAYGVPERS